MIDRFNNISIKHKITMLYFIIVLIPVICTNIIVLNIIAMNVDEEQRKDLESVGGNVQYQIERDLTYSDQIANYIITDINLNNALEEPYDSQLDFFDQYFHYLRHYFNFYQNAYQIKRVCMYTNNQTIVNGGYYQSLSDIEDTNWYASYKKAPNKKLYTYYVNDFHGKRKKVLSYIREYYTRELEAYHKIIKIDLDIDNFNKYILDNYSERIYIHDPDGLIIFTNDERFVDDSTFYTMDDVDMEGNSIVSKSSINMSQGLSYGMVLTRERTGLLKYENLLSTTLLLILINLILPSIMMIIFYKSINTRLNTVTDFIKSRKENDFSTIDITPAKDEIGILISSFNKMNTQNKVLIEDVYEANIQKQNVLIEKKQAEINALLSQINPHFLFNSLETIRMRSLLKGEKETANMIMCLSKIFRNSLNWQSNLIPVEDEINIVKMLLEIEKYRFDEKLNYKIICDDAILQCKIPKMCIVTFVENACIHGIESIDYTGVIIITLKKDGDYVLCDVIDNGKGMASDKIMQLKNYLFDNEKYEDKIGMKNVFKRFKLLYNDDFTFDIANREPHGFGVRFRLPTTSRD